MQAVAVAIAKATWAWVRGKCEEAMREVLGAGRGVQAGEVETPAMAAEAGRETRRGAESDKESDGDEVRNMVMHEQQSCDAICRF